MLDRLFRKKLGFLVFLLLLLTAFERPARAYTDPGSIALLWQGVVAGLIGGSILFRRVLGRLMRRRRGEEHEYK